MAMTDRAYQPDDYGRIIRFLRACYRANRDQSCWLAQRWEDFEYRVNVMNMEKGEASWHSRIRLWEEDGELAGVCNGEEDLLAFMQCAPGRESLFPAMLDWVQATFTPLETSANRLGVVATFSRAYKTETLWRRGYTRDAEGNSHHYRYLDRAVEPPTLPEGYAIVFGDEVDDLAAKHLVCEYGFHPEMENASTASGLGNSFARRATAPMYSPRYEVMIRRGEELCSYLFAYVDAATGTAMIEPVSTRRAHRRKGLARAMILALLARLRDDGVGTCYVESFGDERRRFYASAGFLTRDIDYRWTK